MWNQVKGHQEGFTGECLEAACRTLNTNQIESTSERSQDKNWFWADTTCPLSPQLPYKRFTEAIIIKLSFRQSHCRCSDNWFAKLLKTTHAWWFTKDYQTMSDTFSRFSISLMLSRITCERISFNLVIRIRQAACHICRQKRQTKLGCMSNVTARNSHIVHLARLEESKRA